MWSRSALYRFSAVSAFPAAFLLGEDAAVSPGFARRICSGALLQFVSRKDFYHNDIPSLGFYGHKDYCIQSYSSPGSPFTMFIPFMALALPENSPFWTATENEGDWELFRKGVSLCEIERPAIFVSRYGPTGTAQIQSGKIPHRDCNYNKLCYNSAFPWEDDGDCGISAMQYSLETPIPNRNPRDGGGGGMRKEIFTPEKIFYVGEHKGILYRQIVFNDDHISGVGWILDLAEIQLPFGVLRVDRARIKYKYSLSLGHFGLPHLNNIPPKIEEGKIGGYKFINASIPGRQLAFVPISGWQGLQSTEHQGRNAESESSTVIFAKREMQSYPDCGVALLISLLMHRTDDEKWKEDELCPLLDVKIHEIMPSGSVFGAEIRCSNSTTHIFDFNEIDGRRMA